MKPNYRVPGVYKEEILLKAQPRLPTGIPGFVGFVDVRNESGAAPDSPVALHRKDEFDTNFKIQPQSYLAEAVAGFFLNGGVRCYVARADISEGREAALKKALESLAPLNDLDLIAVPDAMTIRLPNDNLDIEAVIRVQMDVLNHCRAHGGRMAILDALPGADEDSVIRQRKSITRGAAEPMAAALYYPWLKIGKQQLVPPCGHIAGIFARSDARAGVFKAPANEEILGALDLETSIDNSKQDKLNPEGINCLRAFPGRGIRVWGARTISRDSNWRYINVRRLFLMLDRWIDMNMTWANFEPNTPRLWVRIRRELGAYINGLWKAGALVGQTAEQAYYVKCDAETNPPDVREAGQTVTEVGLAPSMPAEFVVVRIVHHTGVEPH
ncbi:MAG TPA: phage tail sheath subtilisin-like domain-containing protein [Blastocatellia bacterium]|nr:phage tail sheath subtilisin-like domain-containing protein [Blastocatellia bacterium]